MANEIKEPMLTLEEWDKKEHSEPHSIRTLRKWANNGNIQPPPEKRGRRLWVHPHARYVPNKIRVNNAPENIDPRALEIVYG